MGAFLVPMLLRGNAYSCMGYHGGPWEPEKTALTTKVTKNEFVRFVIFVPFVVKRDLQGVNIRMI